MWILQAIIVVRQVLYCPHSLTWPPVLVPAIAVCTSESALVKHKEMDLQFTSGQLSGDPWSHVDVFGRASLLKTLTDSFISLKGVPLVGVSTSSRASSVSTSAGKKLNWAAGKAQKLAFFGDIPQSEISKTVKELRQGSSKG